MATWRGITYVERVQNPSSPEDTIDGVNSRAYRTLEVTYVDALTKAKATAAFIGYSELSASRSSIVRILPHQHPDFGWMFATTIPRIQGVSFAAKIDGAAPYPDVLGSSPSTGYIGNIPVSAYNLYRFTIEYRALTYEIMDDVQLRKLYGSGPTIDESCLERYVTKIVKPGTSAITLKAGSLYYANVNPAEAVNNFNIPKMLPEADLQLTWHQIPRIAVPSKLINATTLGIGSNYAIDTMLGKTNLYTFAGYPIGTILFTAAELTPIRMADGSRGFDITYRFKLRDSVVAGIGVWNCALWWDRVDGSYSWKEVVANDGGSTVTPAGTTADAGKHVFDYADFRYLFRPLSYPMP